VKLAQATILHGEENYPQFPSSLRVRNAKVGEIQCNASDRDSAFKYSITSCATIKHNETKCSFNRKT